MVDIIWNKMDYGNNPMSEVEMDMDEYLKSLFSSWVNSAEHYDDDYKFCKDKDIDEFVLEMRDRLIELVGGKEV